MQRAPEIRAYPWHALDTVPREAAHLMRDARRAVRRAVAEEKIAEALSELLGEHVSMLVSEARVVAEDGPIAQGVTLALATPDDAVRVQVDVENELARSLVARIIRKPTQLGDPRAPVAPEIEGSLMAIVCAVARRAHGTREALRPLGPGALRFAAGERRLDFKATVSIGSDAYFARLMLQIIRPFVGDAAKPMEELLSLGELPIELPVVAASSMTRTIDVYGFAPGDVWMPGDGWSVRRAHPSGRAPASSWTGDVVLAPPGGERGIRARIGEGGDFVVVGVETTRHDAEVKAMSGNQDDSTATSDVVLDAPLVVRVELGAVTLTAREWAALRPGDVIELGRRVSEPVVLRIAGILVAQGELVDIEGELGVRIREKVKST